MAKKKKSARRRRTTKQRVSAPFLLAGRLLDIRATHRLMLERLAARGTIAIMFTDIVNFTAATEIGGDDTATTLLDAHDAIVTTHVSRHKGRIVKSLGDGSMAAFTSTESAVQAAVEILQSVRALPAVDGFRFRIRVGIDTGKPSPRGDDYIGHTVNIAARLTRRARPGEALVTESLKRVVKQLDGDARWEPLGQVPLKGMKNPPRTWRLVLTRARKKTAAASASPRKKARRR